MRWWVFLIAALLMVALDNELVDVLRVGAEGGGVRPLISPALCVFICFFAPRTTCLLACWAMGLLLDLTGALTVYGPEVVRVVGPNALGYALGGMLLLQLRSMVFRRRPLTIGVLAIAFMVIADMAAMAVLTLQSAYADGSLHWGAGSAWSEFVHRFLTALYSGVIAVPVGWLLLQSLPLWGFPTIHRGRTYR